MPYDGSMPAYTQTLEWHRPRRRAPWGASGNVRTAAWSWEMPDWSSSIATTPARSGSACTYARRTLLVTGSTLDQDGVLNHRSAWLFRSRTM